MKKYNIAYYFLKLRSEKSSFEAVNYLLNKTEDRPKLRVEIKKFLAFNHQIKFI